MEPFICAFLYISFFWGGGPKEVRVLSPPPPPLVTPTVGNAQDFILIGMNPGNKPRHRSNFSLSKLPRSEGNSLPWDCSDVVYRMTSMFSGIFKLYVDVHFLGVI